MNEIQTMLSSIETAEGNSAEDLKCLALTLGSDPKMKECFFHLDGGERIAKFLDSGDWDILNQSLRVLGNAANCHVGNQVVLTNRKVFRRISIILNNKKHGNIKTVVYAMNLISSLINGNAFGQTLARETGCLSYLNKKFHEMATALSNCCKEQKELDLFKMMWNALCLSLRMVMTNPQNCDNQNELRHYIKQVTDLLDILLGRITTSYHAMDFLHELVPLIKLMIVDNSSNQLKFAMYNGLQVVLSGLLKLQNLNGSASSIQQLMVKMVELLCTSVNDNEFNSQKAGSLGAIPILLSLLNKLEDKTALLIALIQLLHNSEINRKRFDEEDGANIISTLTENLQNYPELLCAISCLLKYCSQNNSSKVQKLSPEKSVAENVNTHSRISQHNTSHILSKEESIKQNNVQAHSGFGEMKGSRDQQKFKDTVCTDLNVSDSGSPVKTNRTLYRKLLPPFKPGLTFYLFSVMEKNGRSSEKCVTDTHQEGSVLNTKKLDSTKKRKNCGSDMTNEDSYSSTLKHNFATIQNALLTTKQKQVVGHGSNSELEMTTEFSPKDIRERWLQQAGSSLSCGQTALVKNNGKCYRKLLETASVVENVNDKVAPASRWPYLLVKDLPKDIQYLVAGVNRFGMDFKKIRETYNFENSLTAKDLYELWKTVFIHKEKT